MEETIISWNVTNWITIVLMVAVGFALFAVAQKIVLHFKNEEEG